MKYNVLTQLSAKSAPAGRYADGQGLWLVKSAKERGKWVLRLFVDSRRREMGLGRWPDVTIAEARDRAAGARKTLRSHGDPIETRRTARVRVHRLTVAEAIQGCFEARKAELKGDGKAGRWMSPLSVHAIPKIGSRAVEDIDQHVLKELFEPLWHQKPEAAIKALNRLNLTLQHAAALGLEVDLQATAKTRALLGKQRHSTTHIPSLPYAELPAFYESLQAIDGTSALALRFLILTCARTTEVRLATFDEIDDAIWTLPAERTKTAVARRIPLTGEARAVLSACRKKSDHYVFPAYLGKPISDAAMSAYMRRQDMEARPHGFRATFRSWAEEATDATFEVKEAVLGHAVDRGVVGAYQRSDRFELRRSLMEQWERFLVSHTTR